MLTAARVALSSFTSSKPRCEPLPSCSIYPRPALTAAALTNKLSCFRQLSDSRCQRRRSRCAAGITCELIIHDEPLRHDSWATGRSGCAAGCFGSCDLGRSHRHFDRRRQREVSLSACSRACTTCLSRWAPVLPHGQVQSRVSRGSRLSSAHVVQSHHCHRCASRRALEHPWGVRACAVRAYCPSPAHGDLAHAGAEHMHRLG